MSNISVQVVETKVHDGQKAGTSGLRKKVRPCVTVPPQTPANASSRVRKVGGQSNDVRRVGGLLGHAHSSPLCQIPCSDLQVNVFQQEHYLANFVQSTFNALPADDLQGVIRLRLSCYSHSSSSLRGISQLTAACLLPGGVTCRALALLHRCMLTHCTMAEVAPLKELILPPCNILDVMRIWIFSYPLHYVPAQTPAV